MRLPLLRLEDCYIFLHTMQKRSGIRTYLSGTRQNRSGIRITLSGTRQKRSGIRTSLSGTRQRDLWRGGRERRRLLWRLLGGNNCQCVGAGPGEDGIVVEAEAGASTDLSSPGSECDISRCGDDEWCPRCWNAPQLTGKAVTGIGNVAIQCAWL